MYKCTLNIGTLACVLRTYLIRIANSPVLRGQRREAKRKSGQQRVE